MMTPLQCRAAELLRRGCSQREVGRAVGRSERTIRVWLRDVEGVWEAAQALPGRPGDLMPVEMLQLALGATRGDGGPDWSIRVSAAKALLRTPGLEQPVVVSVPPGGIVVFPDALDAVLGEL